MVDYEFGEIPLDVVTKSSSAILKTKNYLKQIFTNFESFDLLLFKTTRSTLILKYEYLLLLHPCKKRMRIFAVDIDFLEEVSLKALAISECLYVGVSSRFLLAELVAWEGQNA